MVLSVDCKTRCDYLDETIENAHSRLSFYILGTSVLFVFSAIVSGVYYVYGEYFIILPYYFFAFLLSLCIGFSAALSLAYCIGENEASCNSVTRVAINIGQEHNYDYDMNKYFSLKKRGKNVFFRMIVFLSIMTFIMLFIHFDKSYNNRYKLLDYAVENTSLFLNEIKTRYVNKKDWFSPKYGLERIPVGYLEDIAYAAVLLKENKEKEKPDYKAEIEIYNMIDNMYIFGSAFRLDEIANKIGINNERIIKETIYRRKNEGKVSDLAGVPTSLLELYLNRNSDSNPVLRKHIQKQ